ncbi:MAG: quinone-dependent dihydroorotate dehydrogenase [Candidatus Kerfeldbacteria bacterium]|nr:quinone-dependent dihydroorotate dehydrogenase [Candidatus Kerfeldbacteria bacterium]
MIYRLLRKILFKVDAERIHSIMHTIGAFLSSYQIVWRTAAFFYRRYMPSLRSTVAGITFESPVGLAAGFDKPGELIDMMYGLDFGFTEVGTVTPRPQAGNPQPRLFRLQQDRAILNRMGFNNDGVERFVSALKKRKSPIIVGGNIGKNKDTDVSIAEIDYRACAQAIAPFVDYITINVSSPNTPGLRSLQNATELRRIIVAVMDQVHTSKRRLPVFLKIAPDITDELLRDILHVVNETHCNGLIVSNTTISREGLHTDVADVRALGDGGISGAPVHARAVQLVSRCYRLTNGALPIIGVGGIFTADDAYELICAGASLVQLYTGLIYEGPSVAYRINRGLDRLLRRDGFTSITQAVGSSYKNSVQ